MAMWPSPSRRLRGANRVPWRAVGFGLLAWPWALVAVAASGADVGWPDYGGDAGGSRYSAAAEITPMTYVRQGRQFVVIAAGGHGEAGTVTSDAIVAFSLPAAGEVPRSGWDRTIDQPGGRFAVGALGAATVLLLAFALLSVRVIRRRRRA